jgi:hypothetical protein
MSSNETYRATGAAATLRFIITIALGIAAIIVVMTQLPSDVNGGLAFGMMLAMGIVLAIVLFFVVRGGERRHARAVETLLAVDGFTFHIDPTLEQQTEAAATIGRLALLTPAAAYVSWLARRTTAQGDSVVLRHAQLIGEGEGAQELVTMVVAVPTPRARVRAVEGVWLTRRSRHDRRAAEQMGAAGIPIGEPGWDDAYHIQAADPGAPARLLASPGVRELIAAGPAQESWAVTPTHTLCIFAADTTPAGIAIMLGRATRMAELAAAGS